MNDLSQVRALRADAPAPDGDRLAPQRALLLAEFRQEAEDRTPARPVRRPRVPRRRIVLMSAAATAALAVTGGIVVSLPDHDARTPTTAGGPQVLSARASADTLELAAATVQKSGAAEPGPKQWVYEKSTSMGQGPKQTAESWTRWDGTGYANLPGIAPSGSAKGFDPNKLQVWYGPNQEAKWKKEGYDDRSQRQFYDFLATLPSDPDAMMKKILQKHAIGDVPGETAAQRDWREIDVLYRSVLIPPNAQAGLFRALAAVSGARVETGIKDPAGRPAIGVTVTYPEATASGWQGKQELFFDPTTYAYLAEIARAAPPTAPAKPRGRVVVTRNDGSVGTVVTSGTVAMTTVRDAWGVVDRPGERP
ncbi:hypothetical protein SAMN05216223_106386 [Actinacidiphila yanglinensis]|uniref:CU044_5270 family protein n=1 Tax=Actinacidiphila yanglinensis TaxID=310779 RepID=A0A1H6BCD9_9ACTN|nr:CU044_5270 family protein [Actinacidiphila yanglinensis]SEG58035.1 hypothetical protein SAMN05216223_106386 [Actinacidiphila yanglinensis]